MWQSNLKKLRKELTTATLVSKKVHPESHQENHDDINFAEYCNSIKIVPIKYDTVSNNMIAKPRIINARITTQSTNNYISDFDFIDIDSSPSNNFKHGQHNIPKELRNSQYKINVTIDIHGLNKQQAWNKLESTLSKEPAGSVIKIIHGQGTNSEHNQPILQSLTRKFLYHHTRVLAYTYGSPEQGGYGVTIVKLLKN